MDLKPGEVLCNKCNGVGDLGMHHSIGNIKINGQLEEVPSNLIVLECDKCFGVGKLDWIENVVGSKAGDYKPWYAPAGFTKGKINAIKTR